MKLQFSFFALASVVVLPNSAEASTNDHGFIPATAADVRSPCPGLNTLANHGCLLRDGRNFTIPQLMDTAALNVNWDPILVAAKFGLLTRDEGGSFDKMSLDALAVHNMVEHDASMSRNDFGDGTGDSQPALQRNHLRHARQRQRRIGHIRHGLCGRGVEYRLRSRESALYLSIFGDPSTGVASKKFVQIFFREERLPIAEGWAKPSKLITVDTLTPLERNIVKASNWTTQPREPLRLGPNLIL
ncbi:Cloroperoxidase [Mycena polygramma]|nr:Cloroperoxidase [Mycena polygramma]